MNSVLKGPIVAYNTRQHCFIFFLKIERDIQREKEKLEVKSTVVINVVLFPERWSVGVSLSESIRNLRCYHYSHTSNTYQPYSSLFVK